MGIGPSLTWILGYPVALEVQDSIEFGVLGIFLTSNSEVTVVPGLIG
ncbi:hypothetical protein VCHA43P273_540001 [Vibrio chagasii]|nr:hypothetical protein VCHA43P273_540001 [Vibrio chagasii]